MQFIDLKSQQKLVREKIENNIKKVLDHGRYINGPEVSELEEKLADYTGTKFALGVSSGTDALLMPLMAYNIGPGDAVFTTAFSFIATAEVISLLRATPVFVDIDMDTFNIDVKELEKAIDRTRSETDLTLKGIIPVDLFGQAADYDEINKIANKNNMFVLEDAAQSFGGTYKGKKNCSIADVAATSFFPAKPFGCYGDGGMIFTDDEGIYEKLKSIRVHGQGKDKYDNIRIGINGRLDTIQAAIMLAKFDIFQDEIDNKQLVADTYNNGLDNLVKTPMVKEVNVSAWAQYSILSDKRDSIITYLKEQNIPAMVYYRTPLPYLKAYEDLGYSKGDFPVSEEVSEKIFSLPMHGYFKDGDQEMVIKAVREGISK